MDSNKENNIDNMTHDGSRKHPKMQTADFGNMCKSAGQHPPEEYRAGQTMRKKTVLHRPSLTTFHSAIYLAIIMGSIFIPCL